MIPLYPILIFHEFSALLACFKNIKELSHEKQIGLLATIGSILAKNSYFSPENKSLTDFSLFVYTSKNNEDITDHPLFSAAQKEAEDLYKNHVEKPIAQQHF